MREAAGDDGIVFVDELADVLKSWHQKVEATRVAREGKKKSDGAGGSSCAIS
jgi:ATP-dependent protease HslVU (ClpYQ) ATPase subunit